MGWVERWVRRWRTRRRPSAPRPHFAALAAMEPAARLAALTGSGSATWIEAAARHGITEAQHLHAQALRTCGEAETALRWFRAAAGAGYAPALNMVGRCLELGWGTAPDPAEAARHYRAAAEAGSDWGAFNLGMLLLYGLGVPKDRAAAYGWFGRAVALGHAKAANMLGRFHEEGWDRPRDMGRAAAFYRMAASGGDYRGQFNLAGLLLAEGRRTEALTLMQQAWAAGSPDFHDQAGRALRASGDPALAAIPASLLAAPSGPVSKDVGLPKRRQAAL